MEQGGKTFLYKESMISGSKGKEAHRSGSAPVVLATQVIAAYIKLCREIPIPEACFLECVWGSTLSW